MNILLTGAAGFIGKNVARLLDSKQNLIYMMVRPGTDHQKIAPLNNSQIIECDLADIKSLQLILADLKLDAVIHIGALRGGRGYNNQIFTTVNVTATQILAQAALKKQAKFVFCSSVGVFGAIPSEFPATNSTPTKGDTHYHQTKIEAEEIIRNLVKKGLNAVIIRPSITYGTHDYGFPLTLTRFIDKKLLVLPAKQHKIHLTNVDLLAQAFVNATSLDLIPGAAYIVADKEPVSIHQLADFICTQLKQKNYPRSRFIPLWPFRIFEKMAIMLHNDTWQSRFQLLSYNWYYQVDNSIRDLKLPQINTIPAFKSVIDWYKEL